MQRRSKKVLSFGLVTLLAWGLSACGVGDDLTPKASINKVYVMGDSLADAGTFGFKFTQQDTDNTKGFPIWPQIVAGNFGLNSLSQCNFFSLDFDSSVRAAPNPACTNFAIGGSRIYARASEGGSTGPLNVGVQLATKAKLGAYTTNDLLLINGGGNDAADLVDAYMGASSGAAGAAVYQNFLLQQLDENTVGTLLSVQSTGPAQAGTAYMQKLADTLYGQIKTQALDNGANHVSLLNVPDITLTPRFSAVLAGVSQQQGALAAQNLQGVIRQWIEAFNAQLQKNIGSDSRVALVDFYADFTDQINNPSKYGLTNVADASCPVTGVGNDGLPNYNFPACTSAALDTQLGKSTGWWRSYAFSDNFHPSPLGHSLLATSVTRSLARAGWL
jgi:outer membrane lipase/esterase